MLAGLHHFFQDQEIALVTSQRRLLSWGRDQGLSPLMLDEIASLPASVLDISCSFEHQVRMRELIARSPNVKMISIPQGSFDGRLPALIYSCERLFESDIVDSVSQQVDICSLLEQAARIVLRDARQDHDAGYCDLGVEIEVAAFDNTIFLSHGTCSVAQLFEVSIEHADMSLPAPFDICGEFNFSGLLAARSPHYQGPRYQQSAVTALLLAAAEANSARIVVRHNQIAAMLVDGFDLTSGIRQLTGPRALHLTEFAIGLNGRIVNSVDWRINSQMNEGVKGIHLGVGDGVSGLHIDILCPDLSPMFMSEDGVLMHSAKRHA